MTNVLKRLLPRLFGTAAAIGALSFAAPATIASACPEHDKGSDAGGSDAGSGGGGGAGSSAGAKSKASAGNSAASAKSASSTTKKTKGSDADPLCSGGPSSTGPCGPSGN